MATYSQNSARRVLTKEYQKLQEEPVEGFLVQMVNENIFEWEVAIFGPPQTVYEGGYFKANMTFPPDYPFSPPKIKFTSQFFHPNVYENGELCVSILHPPSNAPVTGDLPCETWNPAQSARTVLLSVISLMSDPCISNPANANASFMYLRWITSEGEDTEYENTIRQLVNNSKLEAEKDGVVIPLTLEEYCRKRQGAEQHADCDKFEFSFTEEDTDNDDYDDDDDNNHHQHKNQKQVDLQKCSESRRRKRKIRRINN